jgi:hypothetical protein
MEHDSLVLHLPETANARVFGWTSDVPTNILPVSPSVPAPWPAPLLHYSMHSSSTTTIPTHPP